MCNDQCDICKLCLSLNCLQNTEAVKLLCKADSFAHRNTWKLSLYDSEASRDVDNERLAARSQGGQAAGVAKLQHYAGCTQYLWRLQFYKRETSAKHRYENVAIGNLRFFNNEQRSKIVMEWLCPRKEQPQLSCCFFLRPKLKNERFFFLSFFLSLPAFCKRVTFLHATLQHAYVDFVVTGGASAKCRWRSRICTL